MDDLLLLLHILFAAAWIGTALFFAFAGPRFGKKGGPAAIGWLEVVFEALRKFVVPSAVLTALTGVLLVITQEEWGWSDPFVSIGLGVFIVVIGIGTGYSLPNLRKASRGCRSARFSVCRGPRRKAGAGRPIGDPSPGLCRVVDGLPPRRIESSSGSGPRINALSRNVDCRYSR